VALAKDELIKTLFNSKQSFQVCSGFSQRDNRKVKHLFFNLAALQEDINKG